MTRAVLLLILSISGLGISLYMTRKYYRLKREGPAEDEVEQSVVQTEYARVFLVPNSLLGIFFYAAIAAVSIYRLAAGRWILVLPLFIAASASVVFSIYLAWSLIYRLKTSCPLCFTSHILNLVITMLLASLLI